MKTYIIPGSPIALARPRFAHRKIYDSQKNVKLFAGLQLVQQHGNDPLFEGPLHLDVTFYMNMPSKGTPPAKCKKQGTYHTYRPDLSNLLKFYEDICVGVLFKDDSLIASVSCRKIYDKEPRTEFTLRNL